MILRDYQKELVDKSAGSDNVLIQADTGAGKTAILAEIAKQNECVLVVAHRVILVKQLSRELARFGVQHSVISQKHTQRMCELEHRKLGADVLRNNNKFVVSIDTLLSQNKRNKLKIDRDLNWLIIVDEAHHMISENKWGDLAKIFTNARILGATATPCRLDQQSLSKKSGGVFDRLIQAEELKENSLKKLIKMGFVSDFKAYSVPENLDVNNLKLGKYDYTSASLIAETTRNSVKICGDAVKHYKRLANNKQALVFCASIELAKEASNAFKNNNITSAAIHSKMTSVETARVFELFEQRHIKVLCNVDMIGEGVDVPEIEALIMLRKTASFGLYRQFIGRSLRPESGKNHAILIDHVGNIRTHGMPDKHINWSLENPHQAVKSNLIPCPNCHFLISAWIDECPECNEDLRRSSAGCDPKYAEYVDKNLVEMKRKEISKEHKAKLKKQDFENVLQITKTNKEHLTHIEKTLYKLKIWCAEVLQSAGIAIADINIYFESLDNSFWLKNFTIIDICANSEKQIKVYKTWLKSN